jgi:ABC-type enterochelin transport system substrate-binding protein
LIGVNGLSSLFATDFETLNANNPSLLQTSERDSVKYLDQSISKNFVGLEQDVAHDP